MSRWFSGTSAAGPVSIKESILPEVSVRPALLRLAAREAAMLEGQVNFLTPELLQVDSLVREAAGTLEDALKTLNHSVLEQHSLASQIQSAMHSSPDGGA